MLSTAMTMAEAVRAAAAARPDQEVFVCGATRLTNRQLLEAIDSAAAALAGLGITPGDKVAALLPPGPEFAFLFFAAAAIGAVFVPLSPELRERALLDTLNDARPAALVTAHPVDIELAAEVPGLRYVISTGDEDSVSSLARLMKEAPKGFSPAKAAPSDLLALLYTSGTTGRPKATMHSHASLIAPVVATLKVRELWARPSSVRGIVEVAKALARYRTRLLRAIGRPQTIMSTVGWHSITGLHVMLQGLLMGDRLLAMPRFHPHEALELVERERVTVLVTVPTAWQALVALPETERFDTSSLIVCASGGAPCPPELARAIQKRFGCALYNGFGMTEAAGGISVSSLSDTDEQQTETVGRVMPGIDARIVDADRRDVPPGQVGELAVKGEGVMLGYYQAPELTARVKDGEGWLYTGDLARIDEKGYLHVVGRSKDVIIRGGQNIYPAEVEEYLLSHPDITEAAVVGVPSVVGGESVWAFLRVKDGAQLSVRDVLDFCRGKIETYKIPSEVRFVSALPRAESGKVQKFKLRETAIREMKGGAA